MTTKEMIAVMQASEEGKTIQYRRSYGNLDRRDNETWEDHRSPGWDWVSHEYRVKPEPVEIDVWFDQEGHAMEVATLLGAKKATWIKKKFREVIE